MNPEKAAFAQESDLRTLDDVIAGADLFLGLSGPGVLTGRDGRGRWRERSDHPRAGQPEPGDRPGRRRGRPTRTRSSPPGGRTIRTRSTTSSAFRSSSAARSTSARPRSTTRCRSPASRASRRWRAASSSAEAAAAYQGERLTFGRDYLIPKPFDPRLLAIVASAVARGGDGDRRGDAAGGRPRTPTRRSSTASVFRSAFIMRRVFEVARTAAAAHRLRRGRGRAGAARRASR